MAFASRGIHDEGHSGEIDPGIQRVYDKTGQHRGYVWVGRHPDNPQAAEPYTKYVLLFDGYVIPGNPNLSRDGDACVRFTWDAQSLTIQQAIAEYQKNNPNAAYTLARIVTTVLSQSW